MKCNASISNSNTHLTIDERRIIETGIRNGSTHTAMAQTIGKSKSAIGKEIKLHREIKSRSSLPMECAGYKHCKYHRNCSANCQDYVPFTCKRRDRSPGACNGCPDMSKCRFTKYWYNPEKAQNEYREKLVECRVGANLTTSEAKSIADTIRPELQKGKSVYQILQAYPNLGISEKTLYTYIEDGTLKEWGVDQFLLRRKVGRKMPKAKKSDFKKREDRSYLQGRTYADYNEFKSMTPNAMVVQMDTVYNDVSNGPFIQTFKFIQYGFLFGLYHEEKTAESMLSGLRLLEKILGDDLFRCQVQVLLTDRGSEFVRCIDIEDGPDGVKKCHVFFCDPMCSGQKGSLENKHEELRYICPKSTDLRALGLVSQEALNCALSNINSAPQESLLGKSPLDLLEFFAPDLYDAFKTFGIDHIPFSDIVLKPYLLKQYIK